MIKYFKNYYNSVLDLLLLFAVILVIFSGGCVAHTHTATTDTAVSPVASTTVVEPGTTVTPGATVTTTPTGATTSSSTTTTTTEGQPHSVLGAIFYAVGEVVALPFKLVGGFFDWVF
jgi:hypothetical protein